MSTVHGSWGLERFDDGTTKLAGEIQLKKYGLFLDEYATQLKSIETALEDDLGDAWNFSLDPIALDINPFEGVRVTDLIRTDNKIFNKVTTVLAALCIEMEALVIEGESKYYAPLLLYEEALSEKVLEEGQAQVHISKMLPVLQDIANFVQRSYEVIQNVIHQLAKIYTKESPTVMDVTNVRYLTLFEHLGNLLRVMITLDKIINSNITMQDHWRKYKRMLKTVNHNVETFNMTEKKIRPFEKLLLGLEGQVLQGRIFNNCMNLRFDGRHINVTRNILLSEEFLNTLKLLFNEIESRLGESNEIEQRHTFVGILGLFVMHYRLFRSLDKKFFKQLFDVYKKIPGVHLAGTILLFPDSFLVENIPDADKIIDKKTVDTAMQARYQFLSNNNTQLSRLAQSDYLDISAWMLDMDAVITGSSLDEVLSGKAKLFIKGVKYAYNISHFVRTTMNLHIALEKPMTKSAVLAFCRLIELLKSIQYTFHRRSMYISESVNHIVQHFSFKILTTINLAKKRCTQDKKLTNLRLDIIAALELLKESLNGPGTLTRMMVISIAMHVAYLKRYLKDDEYSSLIAVYKNLEVILDIKGKISKSTNCNFLLWHMVILPVYLKELYSSSCDVNRIHYMLSGYQDCVSQLKLAKHEENGTEMVEDFKKQVMNDIQQNLLLPLCKDIETDLRLSIHQHLQLDDRNPFKVGLQHIKAILGIKPIKFFDDWIDIKGFVTHYLDRTFYNNNTVALHDWKTYTEMRNLASQKYLLDLPESYLPSQTLEQGLDVLEIMRNIHVFVAKYCYNLNNQVFIERASNNKHLNTINIRHIANSIRTHGSGIMNTTVNFTYQFLRKKFFIFSQFLYDEHIKARLIKDIRYFKDAKETLDQKYPYDRAEKFNKGIRKLGVTSDGQSYLDQFRELIIQIGNAMGYIRLIRSGGLHCASNAIRFLPDLEDIVAFKELTTEAGLATETIEAAENVDSAISNLTKNFAQGTDYLKMLVDVFSAEFRDAKNIHLNNFYMILPPMTLNFVEHSMNCKEKVNKKNKIGACFTDDGFVMGVAYILKLLDQYNEFDSLHWFKSVNDKYNNEKNETMKNTANGKDEKLVQTMNLRLKRLMSYQKEFELLYYSMRSARIFFRAGEEIENTNDDKSENDNQSTNENDVDSTTQS